MKIIHLALLLAACSILLNMVTVSAVYYFHFLYNFTIFFVDELKFLDALICNARNKRHFKI